MRRYEKYLIDTSELIPAQANIPKGNWVEKNEQSLEDSLKNGMQCLIIQSIIDTVLELFDVKNVHTEIGTNKISLHLVEDNSSISDEKTISVQSPVLSRKKLMHTINQKSTELTDGGTLDTRTMEISGAIIDLIMDRNEWPKNKKVSHRVHF